MKTKLLNTLIACAALALSSAAMAGDATAAADAAAAKNYEMSVAMDYFCCDNRAELAAAAEKMDRMAEALNFACCDNRLEIVTAKLERLTEEMSNLWCDTAPLRAAARP